MSESALRQALVAAITVSVVGLAALALGAFFAPITQESDASHIVTAVLIRAVLVIVGLAIALFLSYMTGFRIESTAEPTPTPTPKPDPSASSGLVTLLTTPGSRRDALYAGGIVMLSYWLVTTLYVVALGKYTGDQLTTGANLTSFLASRLGMGLVCILAGLGLGGLGARASLARRLTSNALSGLRTATRAGGTAPMSPSGPATEPTDPPAAAHD